MIEKKSIKKVPVENPETEKPILRIENLSKKYGDLLVLKNISMEVMRGEVVVIIGASGSGKSTLLRCINFLEKTKKGKIFLEGKQIKNQEKQLIKYRQQLGMVFQHFNLFPHMTVASNVMEGLVQVKKMDKKKSTKNCRKIT